MGYTATGKLRNLFPSQEWVDEVAHDTVDEVGTRIRDGAAKRTPVARLPEAYKGDFASWITDRGGRTPRTLRDKWVKGDVLRMDTTTSVTIENLDPICVFVEETTRPHLIRANVAKSLRFPAGPSFHYAKEVWHPGTQGVHMMRDTLSEMASLWATIGEQVLERKIADFNAGI
jgi:hypothetical protein